MIVLSENLRFNIEDVGLRLELSKALKNKTATVVTFKPPAVDPDEPPTIIKRIVKKILALVSIGKSTALKPAVLGEIDKNKLDSIFPFTPTSLKI